MYEVATMPVLSDELLAGLAHLDFPVAALDARSRVVWGNSAWGSTAGPTAPNAFLGTSYLEVCDRSKGALAFGAKATAKALRSVLAGRVPNAVVEYPCPTPDEPLGWWRVHVAQGVGPVAAVVSHLDITREHLAEVQLTETSGRLQLLADNTIDAVTLWDAAGICLWASPSVRDVIGVPPTRLMGTRGWTLLPPEVRKQLPTQERLAQLGLGEPIATTVHLPVAGKRRAFEVRIRKASTAPLRYVAVARNIDERVEYERRLHWKQVALDGAEDLANLGLCVWRPDVPWEWSRNLLAMHGVPGERPPTPQAYLRAVQPEDRAQVRRLLQQAQGGALTFRYRLPDGALRSLELQVRGGPHDERIGLWRDVTETLRLRQTVTQLSTERASLLQEYFGARDRERMLVARELHDGLGSTLTGLVLAARRLARPGVKSPRREAAALARQAQSVLETVRSVSHTRHLSHLDALPFSEALEALARGFREVSEARVTVETSQALPSHAPSGLLRIAQECLTNAVRHARATNIKLSCTVSGQQLVLKVEDDGVGLKSGTGTGMGLSGVALHAEALGGVVRFRSRAKRGTSVEVKVPLLFRGWSDS
jgi:two-component system sensor histidine kinase UhpB